MKYTRLYIISILFLFATCTKDKKPPAGTGLLHDLSTTDPTEITTKTAKAGGAITANGTADITGKGVCISTTPNPTITSGTSVGAGATSFTVLISNLKPSTTYYIRAFAQTAAIVYYGEEKSFKTKDVVAPTVITNTSVTNISQDTAVSGGNVSGDGGGTVSARGVCWSSTVKIPTINDSRTKDNTGTGTFNSVLKTLTPNTLYYTRAYATNEFGTAYGDVVEFSTLAQTVPVVASTNTAASITYTSAQSGGVISATGGAPILSQGICWSTAGNPTVANPKTVVSAASPSFTSQMNDLLPGTTYYVRAYATNSIGTGYGPQVQFSTIAFTAPVLAATTAVSSITQNGAYSGGMVTSDGGQTVIARGICWSTTPNPTITGNSKTSNGGGTGSFFSQLTGLSPATTYYVRSYATNLTGTGYGQQVQFATLGIALPSVSTYNAYSILSTSAIAGGSIYDDGGGLINAKGVCWSASNASPTISDSYTADGTGTSSFTSNLTGLKPSTFYYMRAYATNATGTGYGSTSTFTTARALIVGDSYQGGVVAYIFQSGDAGYDANVQHGIIVSLYNQASTAAWGCSGTSITSATGTAIGTGSKNTTGIAAACTTSGIAARACLDFSYDGYTDWYLPSREELNKIYLNRSAISATGRTSFTNAVYWCSSESNSTNAWTVSFINGTQAAASKTSSLNVRAVRNF